MSISVEGEDTELRDLVAESLEKSGTLGKIKVRMNVTLNRLHYADNIIEITVFLVCIS